MENPVPLGDGMAAAASVNRTLVNAGLSRAAQALLLGAILFLPGVARSSEETPDNGPSDEPDSASATSTAMSEALRSSVKTVVVLPGESPVAQATTGSYEKQTSGLYGGAEAGSRVGGGVGTEVGPVSMRIPFPILTYPGALIGGIAGKTQQEIQAFRDELTDELAEGASQPLTNDALASDVFWNLRRLPTLGSKVMTPTAPIPDDTDAILYVGFSGITIDAQRDEAVITTSAKATLRRRSDGEYLYEREVTYQDRDTLRNWTMNDKALWHVYANFARHYLGREIAAEVFDRVSVQHELRPKRTDSVKLAKKNDWQGVSRTLTPSLAWESRVLDDDGNAPRAGTIGEADISYDVEIYDSRRLVYSARQVSEPRHTVDVPLEACQAYRWSVRPVYSVGGETRFGNWMRFGTDSYVSKPNVGKKASEAPAYTQDFASLNIKCGSQ